MHDVNLPDIRFYRPGVSHLQHPGHAVWHLGLSPSFCGRHLWAAAHTPLLPGQTRWRKCHSDLVSAKTQEHKNVSVNNKNEFLALLWTTAKPKTADGSRCVIEPGASPWQKGGHEAEGWKTFRGQVVIQLSTVTNVFSGPLLHWPVTRGPTWTPGPPALIKGAVIAACQRRPQAPLLKKKCRGRWGEIKEAHRSCRNEGRSFQSTVKMRGELLCRVT